MPHPVDRLLPRGGDLETHGPFTVLVTPWFDNPPALTTTKPCFCFCGTQVFLPLKP